ncbi:MAG: hypothetical protein ACXWWA_15450 [Chitinophagaceae bacterium]
MTRFTSFLLSDGTFTGMPQKKGTYSFKTEATGQYGKKDTAALSIDVH